MYAIIKTSGSQYQVAVGDELDLFKLDVAGKKSVTFSDVLLLVDGDKVALGHPTISGASVIAEVVTPALKGPKIRVATYKAKSRHRRVVGHRDHLTRVKITSIVTRENKKSATKPKSK